MEKIIHNATPNWVTSYVYFTDLEDDIWPANIQTWQEQAPETLGILLRMFAFSDTDKTLAMAFGNCYDLLDGGWDNCTQHGTLVLQGIKWSDRPSVSDPQATRARLTVTYAITYGGSTSGNTKRYSLNDFPKFMEDMRLATMQIPPDWMRPF